jgi:hypothetical protein
MNAFLKFVLLPAFAPAAIVALYFTPVMVFGCVNRGLMALAVATVSTVAALVATIHYARDKRHGRPTAVWWLCAAGILVLPVALLFGPLG